ncbi:hypothetical protein FO519_001578 [Halicephalobus sp. NKZ332]|nr:hypothetical protein FO519_001578 [Halicephalobus sp. NKZ332]
MDTKAFTVPEYIMWFRALPYPVRRRFYELSTPVEVYLLRQASKETFTDLKFIKTYVDSLNVGEVYHTKLRAIGSVLELELREDIIPEFVNVRKEVVFLCSPKCDLIQAHSKITGSFSRFILKGKPSFQQFQGVMKDPKFRNLNYFAFCGEFRGQFSLPQFLKSISAIPNTNMAAPTGDSAVRVVDPIDKYSALIVRGTIIGTGILGVALFIRNSRLFAKFEHVSHIPKDFIRKELELRGTVREVTPNGYLRIEHQPVIKLPRLLLRKSKKPVGLLNVRLAGLDISKAGLSYLSKDLRMQNKGITFTVVKPTEGNSDAVDSDVTFKRSTFGRVNLNVDLVRRGYARVFAPEDSVHLKALQTNSSYSRLITRLLTSEKVADRRGIGVWERDSWVESVSSIPSQTTQILRANPVTKLVVLLYHILRDIFYVGYQLTKQGYHLGVTMMQYAAVGYRHFANGVDRLTGLYAGTKSRIQGPKAGEKK